MDQQHPCDPDGRSDASRTLRVQARSFALSSHPVLVSGEIGTGKARFARLLHQLGPHAERPFRRFHCEDEHARFDLALDDLAGGGTMAVEHVECASFPLQRAIARWLSSRSAMRGSLRIVATSRRDLAVEVLEGRFLAELFFRIRVLAIEIPPLRERREDVTPLCRSLLEELDPRRGSDPPEMTADALELALSYRWPGNVRQLRNELTRCATRGGRVIGQAVLAEGLDERIPTETLRANSPQLGIRPRMEAFERSLVRDALDRSQGSRIRAAALLGITRRTLQRKLVSARRAGFDLAER